MLQRYVYSSEGLELVDEQPSASMGDQQTLTEFLTFAAENYPADKTAFVFWNHGGGSVAGAACDELYGNDALTLEEMHNAFSSVWELSQQAPPLGMIGFDTCLMATVDVAYTYSDIAKYLVASEEVEPANGWYYSKWVGALAENTALSGAQLGEIICDAYYEGCELAGTQDSVTLSVTDLSKIGPLLAAYEDFGTGCLTAAYENTGFISQFFRAAVASENYGGNNREEGYTNMVDLGDLVRQSLDMTDNGQNVLNALEDCVLYKVNGPYRMAATGLSCYFSYDGDMENYGGYVQQGAGKAFKSYYNYSLTGQADDNGAQLAQQLQISQLEQIPSVSAMDWDGAALELDDAGTASLHLGPQAQNVLAGIAFQLYYINPEEDSMMLLGTDNDITSDWENGIFYDNFRGVWGALDGNLVYMELNYEGEDYNRYSVPILLNGEEYNLQVVYSFTDEAWNILGAWKGIGETGMADKELRLLQDGDEITTVWKMASYSGDDDFEMYACETVVVTPQLSFGEAPLTDGTYVMIFEMADTMGNYAHSQQVEFACENGEIYTTVYEAD